MNNAIHKWNEKYADDTLVFGSTPNGFLVEESKRLPKACDILCVGDGEGRNGVWLAEQGFDILSVDGAENGVKKAIKQARLRKVSERFKGLCVDLLQWDWPENCYDALVCLHLYFMPEDRPRMHRAMLESLKTKGLIILEVFHPDNVGRGCGGPPLRELCYSADDLESDFKNADILFLKETEREIAPSSFHNGGFGKVTRMVAQK
ncbi:MAG: class I SAM-dependent methyltransferase [Methylocystaceae bacterium]|nr:class I SAM-dependent methyltransferase [Methylocystaceae bacterium]